MLTIEAKAFIGRYIPYITTILAGMCLLQSCAKNDEPSDRIKSVQSSVDSQIFFDDDQPLHPRIFEFFLGSYSDAKPVITSMSLIGIFDSNMFSAPVQKKLDKKGQCWYWYLKGKLDETERASQFGYRYMGRLTTGHHVIMTADETPGSAIFYNLMFIKTSETKLLDFTNPSSVQGKMSRSISCEGYYPLGDRFQGSVQFQGDSIKFERIEDGRKQIILIRLTEK